MAKAKSNKPAEPQAASAPAAAAPAPVVLADNVVGMMRADGANMAETDEALRQFAGLIQKAMRRTVKGKVDAGSLPLFNALALEWKRGYEATRRGITDDALVSAMTNISERAQKAFERRVSQAKSEGLLDGDKPKSDNPESQAKAAKREADKAKREATLGKVDVQAATKQMVKAAAAGDAVKAAELAATIKAATDFADSKAKAAAKDAVTKAKAELSRCVSLIKASDDAALIVRAYKALQPLIPAAK